MSALHSRIYHTHQYSLLTSIFHSPKSSTMSIPTQCRSGRIQGCAHRPYRYAPFTAGTYTPHTTGTKTPSQTVAFPTYKPCLAYKPNPISTPSPTNTATKPAVIGNSTATQENPTTSASPAIACLLVLIILLLLIPILSPAQVPKTPKRQTEHPIPANPQQKHNTASPPLRNQQDFAAGGGTC